MPKKSTRTREDDIKIEYPEELYDYYLERNLISFLVDSPTHIITLGRKLKPEHFFKIEYRIVYKELAESVLNKTGIGRPTLKSLLEKKKLETEWLYKKGEIKSPDEISVIANQVIDLYIKRRLFVSVETSKDDIVLSEKTASDLSSDLMTKLAKAHYTQRPSSVKDVFIKLRQEMKTIQEGKDFRTGFESMDNITPPFVPGHLWIIGAFTGTGKTWFSLQLVKNLIEQKSKVALFSTEMQSYENLGRIIGNETEQGYNNMWKPISGLDPFDTKNVKKYIKEIDPYLKIYDDVRSIEEISAEARSLLYNNDLDICVIDFIQNIDLKNKDSYEAMRQVSQEIQRLAKDLKITMILVSQISNSYAKGGKSNTTLEYKNAGELAAAADVGIMLWDQTTKYEEVMQRPEYKLPVYHKPILCEVKKSRHTVPGSVPLILQFPSGRVIDCPAKNDWIDHERREDYYKSQAKEQREKQEGYYESIHDEVINPEEQNKLGWT